MPAWLNKPGEAVVAPRSKRNLGWLAGLAVVIGLGTVGSQWLLQEHQAESAVEIKQLGAQAEQAAAQAGQSPPLAAADVPVLPPRAASPLPALVLLPSEQGGKPTADAAATTANDSAGAAAPSATPATPVTAIAESAQVTPSPDAPAPDVTTPAAAPAQRAPVVIPPVAMPKPSMPAPVLVKSPDKAPPAPVKAAGDVVKAGPAVKRANTAAATPGGEPVAVKKKPATPKRTAARPVPKKEQAVMLPAPRERADDDAQYRPVTARKCIPGELARECEARLKQR